MAAPEGQGSEFGANSWLVEEMYEQFVHEPSSVSASWQEFFADYRSTAPSVAAAAASSPKVQAVAEAHRAPSDDLTATSNGAPAPAVAPAPAAPTAPAPAAADVEEPGKIIRGAGAAIATNMERSLTVPTATSFRNVPAKLLEVNRKVINGFRARTGQTKVSFTHLIGYAIVRAIADEVPAMKNTYAEGADGKPRLIENEHVSMGLAVDVQKGSGRTLVVPVVRDADT
ncbi:MAG: 2-oxo acid dehydrogenase subunit E2, partial [Ilumatobacteraceae bacterium]